MAKTVNKEKAWLCPACGNVLPRVFGESIKRCKCGVHMDAVAIDGAKGKVLKLMED